MITSPENGLAGEDAADAAFRGKFRKYQSVLAELQAAGISFRPMIWTSEGRPHAAVMRALTFAAERASRKQANGNKAQFLRRWKHEITVQILRRRAAMVRECLPRRSGRGRFLVEGLGGEHQAITGRRGE
eukprot:9898044-Karenia_brevis.AAC.1